MNKTLDRLTLGIKSYRQLLAQNKDNLIKIKLITEELKINADTIKQLATPVLRSDMEPLQQIHDTKYADAEVLIGKINKNKALMQDIIDSWGVLMSVVTLLFSIAFSAFLAHQSVSVIDKVPKEFYITVAGLLPVFLIAISIYTSQGSITRRSYLADIIGLIIPVFIGILSCLIAISTQKSNGLLYWFAMLAVLQLMIDFITRGFTRTALRNPVIKFEG